MLQTHSKSTIPSHSCTNWLCPKLCTLKIPILSANFYHNPSNLGTHRHLLRLPSHPIYITLFQNLTHSFIFTLRQYLHPLPKNLTIRAYPLPIFLSSRLSGLQLLRGILTHSHQQNIKMSILSRKVLNTKMVPTLGLKSPSQMGFFYCCCCCTRKWYFGI